MKRAMVQLAFGFAPPDPAQDLVRERQAVQRKLRKLEAWTERVFTELQDLVGREKALQALQEESRTRRTRAPGTKPKAKKGTRKDAKSKRRAR